MAGYFEEMGWRPLDEGEQPNHLLHIARYLIDYGAYDDNMQWPRLPPPASAKSIEELVNLTLEKNQQCPICLKNQEVGDTVKQMPCRHTFHPSCILTWLSKRDRRDAGKLQWWVVDIQEIQEKQETSSEIYVTKTNRKTDRGKSGSDVKLANHYKTNSCPLCRLELPTDNERYETFKKEKKRAEQRKENIDTLHSSMFS